MVKLWWFLCRGNKIAVVLFPKQGIRFDLGLHLPFGIEKDVIQGFGLVCKTLENTKKIDLIF